MNVIRAIFLLLVPLLAAAPAMVRVTVQPGVPSSAVVRLGARPAHEAAEVSDDVWRGDGRDPRLGLAWESLFSASDSAVASAAGAPAWQDPRGAAAARKPPVESGLGDNLCGRAPPLP